MARRFVGLPVMVWPDRRPLGVVEGCLSTPERGEELLVRTAGPRPVVRRVPGSRVVAAGPRGVQVDLDPARFDAGPPYVPDHALEGAVRWALGQGSPAGVDGFEIQVSDGIVRLRGGIPAGPERRHALDRVRAVAGVLRVVDEAAVERKSLPPGKRERADGGRDFRSR